MSIGYFCVCTTSRQEKRKHWVVVDRQCHFSAFSGYHYTPSDYSCVRCQTCGRFWRTKAAYVGELPSEPQEGKP